MAGHAGLGTVWRGEKAHGMQRRDRRGSARQGMARQGTDWNGRQGEVALDTQTIGWESLGGPG